MYMFIKEIDSSISISWNVRCCVVISYWFEVMCVILGSIHSCNEGTAEMKMRSDTILNEGYSGLQEKYSHVDTQTS